MGGKDRWDGTSPVGSFPANPFGLYDMAGNVWQHCSSLYRDYPYRADDGREDSRTNGRRCVRGGTWYLAAERCRAGARTYYDPPGHDFNLGFRVVLPAGAGGETGAAVPGGSPAGIEFVRIPAGEGVAEFEMGKYEVTVAQFRRFVDATDYKTTAENQGWSWGYASPDNWAHVDGLNWRHGASTSITGQDSLPVLHVSQEDALAFCIWAGGRLPSIAEWEHAARGGVAGRTYVWGEQWPPPPGAGNLADASARRKYRRVLSPIEDYDDRYADLAPVGSFGANGFGLYDMAGNVSERVSDRSTVYRGCDYLNGERDCMRIGGWQGNWGGEPGGGCGFRVARRTGAAPGTQRPPAGSHTGATWTNPKDGREFVFVPAGPFVMGEAQEQHTVTLPGYWIGQCEVTVGQYRKYCEAAGQEMPPGQGEDTHPVVNVTWAEAAAYALWAGCRLPSEAEWEKAARGTDGRMYPWGNTWDPARCNTNEGGPGRTAPVGSYPNGASPSGCLDMAGNVWEWTSTKHKPFPYRADDGREEPGGGDERVPRGGGWNFGSPGARTCNRYGLGPDLRINALGFRLAKSSQ